MNQYSCTLEDALIARYEQLTEAVNLLQELSEEHKAYEAILTDPDILADYTCEFFGANGPYPVEEEQPAYQQVPAMMQQQAAAMQQVPVQPQRPDMPVPPSPGGNVDTQNFWDNFGNVAERDPANAWRYLSMAQQNPSVFRQKLLVME